MSYVDTLTVPNTAFPDLGLAVSERYESLPDQEFAQGVGRSLGTPAEYAESWLSNFGRAFTTGCTRDHARRIERRDRRCRARAVGDARQGGARSPSLLVYRESPQHCPAQRRVFRR